MFFESKQKLTTTDLIVTVGLASAALVSVALLASDSLADQRALWARTTAENLAREMVLRKASLKAGPSSKLPTLTSAAGRSPASQFSDSLNEEGQLGRDPWGRPYQYFIQMNADSRVRRILVWSRGPDGRDDSRLGLKNRETEFRPDFAGDDVGFAISASDILDAKL